MVARSHSIWLTGLSIWRVVSVAHPVVVRGEHRHLAVVEIDDRAGVIEQRRLIGRDEVLALADAEHDRRAVARRDHRARFIRREHHDAVGAIDVAQCRGDRFLEIPLVQLTDQVRQHLGVGLGEKDVPAREQRLLDRVGVLDDAVVNQRDPARLVEVRMRVDRGRRAVRRPARVAHAGGADRFVTRRVRRPACRACPAAL